jgi:O-antigen ligase
MVKKNLNVSEPVTNGAITTLSWGVMLATLGIWTTFNDPFNPVKLVVILMTSAWLTGYIISGRKLILQNFQLMVLVVILILFVTALFIVALLTENKITAFIGEAQRNNGFLFYVGLVVILLVSALTVRFENIGKIYKIATFTGLIVATYGIFQNKGIDFTEWNNPYNPVISTLGNPNFAAATFSVLAILSLSLLTQVEFSKFFRYFGALVFLLSMIAIYLSDARQGLVGTAAGIALYLTIFVHSKRRIYGFALSVIFSLVGVFVILALLQIGPFTSFIYKESISVRGYYWRAGIEMFKSRPYSGVGLDSYGSYFKEFSELNYSTTYGFEITSNNAHNVIIQLFATGGLIVGLPYLSLLGFILWRGILGLKKYQGNHRLILASVFSGWISYQATSFISIDSPSLAMWGWFLGGIIVGLSIDTTSQIVLNEKFNFRKSKSIKLSSGGYSISALLSIFVIIFSIFYFRTETNLYHTRLVYNPESQSNSKPLQESASKTIAQTLANPTYKITAASFLVNSGFINEGITALETIVESDSRNFGALDLLATYYSQMNEIKLAIQKRESIIVIEPWNLVNYYKLGLLYKIDGDKNNLAIIRNKIYSISPSSEIGKLAAINLTE